MDDKERSRAAGEKGEGAGTESRPQRGGEAATTRFGMEEGDNTDIPATGGPRPED